MKESLGIKNVEVIPNGVDLKVFKPIEKMSIKDRDITIINQLKNIEKSGVI